MCFIRRAIFDDMLFYSEGYFPVVWMFSFWKIVWPPNHRKRRRRSKKLKTWSLLRKPKFLYQGLEMNPEKVKYMFMVFKNINPERLLTVPSEEPSSNNQKT